MKVIGEYLDRKIQNADARRQGPLSGECKYKKGCYKRPYDPPAYRLSNAPPMFISHCFYI